MIKKLVFFGTLFLCHMGLSCGFLDVDIWSNSECQKNIKQVILGEQIRSCFESGEETSCKVTGVHQFLSETIIQLKVGGEEFIVGPNQAFFSEEKQDWVFARNLKTTDILKSKEGPIEIESVEKITREEILFDLSIEKTQIFLVGKHGIYSHNFFPVIAIGYTWAIGAGTVTAVGWTVGVGGAVVGVAAIADHVNGNHNRRSADVEMARIRNAEREAQERREQQKSYDHVMSSIRESYPGFDEKKHRIEADFITVSDGKVFLKNPRFIDLEDAEPITITARVPSSSSSSDFYAKNEKSTTPGKMQQEVDRGQAPKSIERVDKGRGTYEKDHVHFNDKSALNSDGTWKHGDRKLSHEEKKWLDRHNWKYPK